MSSRTTLASSGVGFSKSTQRNRFVSAKSVGIRNMGMFSVCNRPCVVKAKDRITLGQLGSIAAKKARRPLLAVLFTVQRAQISNGFQIVRASGGLFRLDQSFDGQCRALAETES